MVLRLYLYVRRLESVVPSLSSRVSDLKFVALASCLCAFALILDLNRAKSVGREDYALQEPERRRD